MNDVDTLISGGEVITAFGRKRLDVLVQDEKIAALLDPDAAKPPAKRTIDARGLYVLPGMIDPHTHIGGGAKVFGSVEEAVKRCTQALAFGGTTTVMEMIGGEKGKSLSPILAEAVKEREGAMAIDFSFHPSLRSVEEETVSELEGCAAEGFPSFHASFEGSRGKEPLNEGGLYRLLTMGRERGIMTIIHAEDSHINEVLIRQIPDSGRMENISRCRPWFSETAAVLRAVFMARLTGGPLYFEHLGAGPSLEVVRAARKEGFPVYAETCPHYLCFSEESYRKPEGVGLLKSPPLRRKEDAEALWEGLSDGTIPSVATDESVALVAEKRRRLEENPAYRVSGGLNQIELRLPVMHTEMVVKRGMPVERLVYCLSTGPARLFGIYPKKGTIAVGSDADLTLFDPSTRWRVRNEELHQGTDYTIFEGWELHGLARTTLLRGQVLVENGKFVGPERTGRWLPRQFDRAVIEATNTLSTLP